MRKMSKDPSKNKSAAKVIYDERVFGGSGSGRGLMDAASSSSAIMDSETEEEYFKRMHEFNNATRVSDANFGFINLIFPFLLPGIFRHEEMYSLKM